MKPVKPKEKKELSGYFYKTNTLRLFKMEIYLTVLPTTFRD